MRTPSCASSVAAALLGACSPGGGIADPDAAPAPDAVIDATADAPPPDASPWPVGPKSGDFAWGRAMRAGTVTTTLATGPDGSIAMATAQLGPIDLGRIQIADGEGAGIVVAKLDAKGEALWARGLDGAASVERISLAVGPDGAVVVGAAVQGSLDLEPRAPEPASVNGFVVRFTADGAVDWARSVAGADHDAVTDVAVGSRGEVVVVGHSSSQVDLGGGVLPPGTFIARFAPGGAHEWSRSWRAPRQGAPRVAMTADGGALMTGGVEGTLVLDDVRVLARAQGDSVVAGFSPEGRARFAFAMIGQAAAAVTDVAVAPSGELYVAGDNGGGQLVVGDHTLPGDGDHEPFVIALEPDGTPRWLRRVPTDEDSSLLAIATDDTSAYVTATCRGAVRLAEPVLCADGGSFLAAWNHEGELRWTSFVSGQAGGLVMAPGRLLVAGDSSTATVRFEDVVLEGGGLYLAEVVP